VIAANDSKQEPKQTIVVWSVKTITLVQEMQQNVGT